MKYHTRKTLTAKLSALLQVVCLMICIPVSAVSPRSVLRTDRNEAEKTTALNNAKYDYKIPVANQAEFDGIWDEVFKALNFGAKNILVSIKQGHYSFNERHIPIINRHYPEANLRIEGNGSEIVSSRDEKAVYCQLDASSFSSHMVPVSAWGQWNQCGAPIDIYDEAKKICRIPARGVSFVNGMMIQVSQWYETVICPVLKCDKNFIYFIDKDLSYNPGRKCWSINEDIRFGGMMPRYRIFNPRIPADYVSKGATFLSLYGSEFESITISGLNFIGNRSENALMMIERFNGTAFVVSDCSFTNLSGDAIYILSSNNVSICRNVFKQCERYAVWSDNLSNGTAISDNVFERMGQRIIYGGVVNCQGDRFTISGNRFTDFPYAAIQLGNHYTSAPTNRCVGIAENNMIEYSESYIDDRYNCTLMDSGAIYVFTICDDVVIRNNTIKNYTGKAKNRGIFCDDGAKNVTICGNVIEVLDGNDAVCLWYPDNVGEYVSDFCENNVVTDNVFINCKGSFEQKPGSNSVFKRNRYIKNK